MITNITNKTLPIFVALIASIYGTHSIQAATLAVDFGGNYVGGNQTLNGAIITTTSGNNRWDIQGDSSLGTVLSPTSGYSGQAFYGALGIAASLPASTPGAPQVFTSRIFDNGSNDEMRVVLQAPNITNLVAGGHLFVLFKKADFLNGLNTETVSLDNTTSFSLTANNAGGNDARFGQGRFLVMNDSTLYMSEANWTLTSAMPVTLNPTSTNWALYDPTALDLNFNQSSAVFSSMNFNNVTGLGFYAERDLMQSGGQLNIGVSSFSVVAVPEPSTAILLLSALGATALARRRQRKI